MPTPSFDAAKQGVSAPGLPTSDNVILEHRTKLSLDMSSTLNWTVGYGPFRGLRLEPETWWIRASFGAMMLGLYEREILDCLTALPRSYTCFVDIGAANGYYVVGAVRSGLFRESHAFETDSRRHTSITANARLNGVADQVALYGQADAALLSALFAHRADHVAVLVDIEGHEFTLLSNQFFGIFRTSVLIVELHDFLFENGSERLQRLRAIAERTHRIESITTGARDLSGFSELTKWSDTDRWLLCSEGRSQLMTWWVLHPLSVAGAATTL